MAIEGRRSSLAVSTGGTLSATMVMDPLVLAPCLLLQVRRNARGRSRPGLRARRGPDRAAVCGDDAARQRQRQSHPAAKFVERCVGARLVAERALRVLVANANHN